MNSNFSNYPNQNGYPNQIGYPNQNVYPNQNGFGNQTGFPNQAGFGNQHGFHNAHNNGSTGHNSGNRVPLLPTGGKSFTGGKKWPKKGKFSNNNNNNNSSVAGLQSHVDKLNESVSQYREMVDLQSETINMLIKKLEKHEEFFGKIASAQWEVFSLVGVPFDQMSSYQQKLVIAETQARERCGKGDATTRGSGPVILVDDEDVGQKAGLASSRTASTSSLPKVDD